MLVLPALLTHEQATACVRDLSAAIKHEPQPTVVVDASALSRFDSSALAVMLECRRSAMHEGVEFRVQGLPSRVLQLAALYGVAELLPSTT